MTIEDQLREAVRAEAARRDKIKTDQLRQAVIKEQGRRRALESDDGGFFSSVDNVVRQMANGITFGWMDEIAAGLNSQFGDANYDEDVAYQRARDAQFRERAPVTATAAEIAGGVGGALAAAPAAVARIVGQGGLRAVPGLVGAGATTGAVAGAGYADGDMDARKSGAKTGAMVGGLLGATLPFAAQGAAKVGGAAARGIQNKVRGQSSREAALNKVAQAMERDGVSPADASLRLRQMGPEAGIMDAGGDNMLGLARAATGAPGKAKDVGKAFVNTRQEGQGSRISGAVERATGRPDDFYDTLDDLIDRRAKSAGRLYQEAFETKPVIDTLELRALIEKSDDIRAAMTQARRLPKYANMPETSIELLDKAYKNIGGKAQAAKRSGDNVLYRDLNDLRLQLKEAIVSQNPKYGEALKAFAGETDLLDALEAGRKFIRQDGEVTYKMINQMSEPEKGFFQLGVARALKDMVYKTPDGSDAAKRLFGNMTMRSKLRAAFPDSPSFRRFADELEAEVQMYKNRSAITNGSPTAPRLAEQADFSGADPLFRAAQGDVGGAAAGMFRTFADWLKRPPEKVADELADMLFTNDAARNEALLHALSQRALQNSDRSRQALLLTASAESGNLSGRHLGAPPANNRTLIGAK